MSTTTAPRVRVHDANRVVVARWSRLIVLARAGHLSPQATAYVLAQKEVSR